MKRRSSEEGKKESAETVQDQYFPDLEARIEALSPSLEAAVRAGNADQVRGIIQQYDAHVNATYSEHPYYDITPAIQVSLHYFGESGQCNEI